MASARRIGFWDLGEKVDGYSDIADGMASYVSAIRDNLLADLKRRNMPNIELAQGDIHISYGIQKVRTCTVAFRKPGAETIAYIGEHGTDLYVSWHTFVKRVLNVRLLVIAVTICFGLGMVAAWLSAGMVGLIGLASGDLRPAFANGLFTAACCLGVVFINAIFAAILVLGIAGWVMRGDPTAFYFVEANFFDFDDVKAMSITMHRSLLRAYDEAGLDVTKLRIKERFKGGRKDDEV